MMRWLRRRRSRVALREQAMIEGLLSEAAGMMQGQLHGADRTFRGVSTDTRTIGARQLFVALDGPNFRGADFVAEAADRGAAGAVVHDDADAPIATIRVDDTRAALMRLASAWRGRFDLPLVGVTGSNGKTTVRSLTAAALGESVLATRGNLNNDIGVPLTLLRLSGSHRAAVIEMGANHAGEIAALAECARPSIGVLTNAGPAHLEGFGSIEGVARAKGELFAALPADGTAIINADDVFADYWRGVAAHASILTFGSGPHADVWFSDLVQGAHGGTRFQLHAPAAEVDISLQLAGRHNALNACAAAAAAIAAGVAPDLLTVRLAGVEPVEGRLATRVGVGGARVIDDAYNANPASMLAAARWLTTLRGEPWMVVGDMGELGDDAAELHRELGAELREAGVERLFTIGPLMAGAAERFGPNASHFERIETLIEALRSTIGPGVNVLVKASRSMRLERVAVALTAEQGAS
jgi:UDP-N-acetylmuramoyl-tripeptide--D-alanyl-D-alanine ligase